MFLSGYHRYALLSAAAAVLLFGSCVSCRKDTPPAAQGYKTRNVIIVVIDGPRYSETWGDTTHALIPVHAGRLAPAGTVYTTFYNDGPTQTTAGHVAITTCYYQDINNAGQELPAHPSIFQLWLKAFGQPDSMTWIITSKDKLAVLSNTTDAEWTDRHTPETHCGLGGLGVGSGHRDDHDTWAAAESLLVRYRPRMALIHFKEPDVAGHAGDWNAYRQAIRMNDSLAGLVWDFIRRDGYYKDKTTLFVTNDHGRHMDGWLDGFFSHGDSCDGCRHINMVAIGPDFRRGVVTAVRRNQVDIPATIAEIMGIDLPPDVQGEVMWEMFEGK